MEWGNVPSTARSIVEPTAHIVAEAVLRVRVPERGAGAACAAAAVARVTVRKKKKDISIFSPYFLV